MSKLCPCLSGLPQNLWINLSDLLNNKRANKNKPDNNKQQYHFLFPSGNTLHESFKNAKIIPKRSKAIPLPARIDPGALWRKTISVS